MNIENCVLNIHPLLSIGKKHHMIQNKTMKTNTCLLRLSDKENEQLTYKSKLFGQTKSKILREGALSYWSNDFDAKSLLKIYQEGNEEDKHKVVDVIMEYYRRKGYPHNHLSSTQLLKEMNKISNTKSPLLKNDHLQTNTVGLSLANHFHPHMVKVKCLTNYRTAYDQFTNDDLFRDAINRWMELNKKPDPSGLRRILRTRNGVRSVVNFKPAISKFIYNTYCSEGDKILDPCAGYSGRLAGCISTNRNLQYHGIDPDGRTAVGGMKMASFFSKQYDSFGNREWNFGFKFDLGCAEDVMLDLSSDLYSLVFTSPPYWGTEQYSNDPNQSYLRHPAYSEWRDNFLFVLLRESQRVVKNNGYIIFNVKDYKHAPIATDLCEMCKSLSLELVKTYQMRLANSEYHRRDGESMYHTEPIFVFRK